MGQRRPGRPNKFRHDRSDTEPKCKRLRMASKKQPWREEKKAESSESEEENNTDADCDFKVVSRQKDRRKNVFRPVEQPKVQPGHGKYNHPIFKEISKANKAVNDMSVEDITRHLAACGLESRGSQEVISKRLKHLIRAKKLEDADVELDEYKLDFIIVIDFEATCEQDNPPGFIHEIIEFPAVVINVAKRETVAEFHSYCRPVINQQLTNFCMKLTGIKQTMVDSSPGFTTVLRRFDDWVKNTIGPTETFAVLTDGPYDIARFLIDQCKQSRVDMPHYFNTWVNIRKHFGNYYKVHRVNLQGMLQLMGMEFIGRPHSGIDDTRNIARIAIQLIKDGCDLKINETFA